MEGSKPKKTLEEYRDEDRRRVDLTIQRFNLNPREQRILESASDFVDLSYAVGKPKRYLPQVSLDKKKAEQAIDPRTHKNWKYFERVIMLCEDYLKYPIREYFRCLLWRTVTEDPDWEVFPTMFVTQWAIDRWGAYNRMLPPERTNEDRKFDLLSTIKLAVNFINFRLYQYPVGSVANLLNFKLEGKIFPEAVLWIFNGVLTVPWCALSRSFWQWIPTLTKDVIDEYIPMEKIYKATRSLIASPYLWDQFREVMNEDLISIEELRNFGVLN